MAKDLITYQTFSLIFWITGLVLGFIGFALSVVGVVLPWEGNVAGIITAVATWVVYGCTILLGGLIVFLASKSVTGPALLGVGSMLVLFGTFYQFSKSATMVSEGVFVSMIGGIISLLSAIFALISVRFAPKD